MQALFDAVNAICAKIQIVSNWFWDFPCNLDWYGSIPILGSFSLAIILLVGTGIYFTFRLHFVQVHNFIFAVKVLMQRNHTRNGISSLTAFLLSTAMRVGPGNILGVTGHRRPGCRVLDVGFRLLRHGNFLCRIHAFADLQGKAR